jgi:murein DD-endopeptidase MepM/ murein hydrolase activator NlpD
MLGQAWQYAAAIERPSEAFVFPLDGSLSSGFGWRNISVAGNRFHGGIDLAAPSGTPIAAARDGVVSKAGWVGAYGYVVYLDHGDGSQTRYAHMMRIDVEAGADVRQGDRLGLVGSTGASTGPHLHFELRFAGRAVDPLLYLEAIPR